MTIQLFRNILKVVIAVDAAWFIVARILLKSLPPELAAYVDADMAAHHSEGLKFFLFASFEVGLVVCWFVNLIGLYKLRSKSRLRFLIIHGTLFFLELFGGPSLAHPLVQVLNDLSEFGHGLLLALIFWSPIAIHFKESPKEILNTA
jgi:hypothetical protein